MRIQCLYGRQECMFAKKGTCPREGQCLLAGELKARLKQEQEEGGEDPQDDDRGEISDKRSDPEGVAVHY